MNFFCLSKDVYRHSLSHIYAISQSVVGRLCTSLKIVNKMKESLSLLLSNLRLHEAWNGAIRVRMVDLEKLNATIVGLPANVVDSDGSNDILTNLACIGGLNLLIASA